MPPSMNLKILTLNFKKMIKNTLNFINLRLTMRENSLMKLKTLNLDKVDDVNLPKIDLREGDKEFKRLMERLAQNQTLRYT